MKKFTLTLLALLSLAFSVTAQDTIFMLGPKSNYHAGYWYYQSGDTCSLIRSQGTIIAVGHVSTKDTLTIYGIAASLSDNTGAAYNDPTPTLLRMYERVSGAVNIISEDLSVNMTNPPTYYMQQDLTVFTSGYTFTRYPVLPVYERYFHNPVKVVDTFYVAYEPPFGSDVCLYKFYRYQTGPTFPSIPYLSFFRFDSSWVYHAFSTGFVYIYPILTPAPDDYEWDTIASGIDTTTVASDTIAAGDTLIVCDTVIVCDTLIVGYDTIINYDTIITYDTLLALPERGLLGRLVGVMPNPAGSTAKVVSSFGLTMVEAFNMAGERLCTLRMPDAPLTATLDVRRWPTGTYLLRIHTPQGVTTKKLTVSH